MQRFPNGICLSVLLADCCSVKFCTLANNLSKLVFEDTAGDFFDGTFGEAAELEGAVAGAQEAADVEAEGFHHFADFAVLPFSKGDGEP